MEAFLSAEQPLLGSLDFGPFEPSVVDGINMKMGMGSTMTLATPPPTVTTWKPKAAAKKRALSEISAQTKAAPKRKRRSLNRNIKEQYSGLTDDEIRALRKKQRIEKNRVAARASRMKKKHGKAMFDAAAKELLCRRKQVAATGVLTNVTCTLSVDRLRAAILAKIDLKAKESEAMTGLREAKERSDEESAALKEAVKKDPTVSISRETVQCLVGTLEEFAANNSTPKKKKESRRRRPADFSETIETYAGVYNVTPSPETETSATPALIGTAIDDHPYFDGFGDGGNLLQSEALDFGSECIADHKSAVFSRLLHSVSPQTPAPIVYSHDCSEQPPCGQWPMEVPPIPGALTALWSALAGGSHKQMAARCLVMVVAISASLQSATDTTTWKVAMRPMRYLLELELTQWLLAASSLPLAEAMTDSALKRWVNGRIQLLTSTLDCALWRAGARRPMAASVSETQVMAWVKWLNTCVDFSAAQIRTHIFEGFPECLRKPPTASRRQWPKHKAASRRWPQPLPRSLNRALISRICRLSRMNRLRFSTLQSKARRSWTLEPSRDCHLNLFTMAVALCLRRTAPIRHE